ncbi:MAG: TonB-dependent receptor [Balneolaceae bacterium]
MSKNSYMNDWKRFYKPAMVLIFGILFYLSGVDSANGQDVSHIEDENIVAQVLSDKKTADKNLISIQFTNISLKGALEILAEKINIGFSFNPDIMPNKKVDFALTNVPAHEVIYKLLEGTNLEPVLPPSKDVIILREKELIMEPEMIQNTITGSVFDAETGEALPGVNVTVIGSAELTGSTIGTTTNVEGYYEVQVPENLNALVFTYIGYQRLEVEIGDDLVINVELNPDTQLLDDVVVVGYGMQNQERVTGSISSIRADEFANKPVTDLSTALQGMASGVEIVRSGGDPGAAGSIRIRGTGTVNNADPLIVIDGMPSDIRSLNNINSDDVESIDVLKDASSAAIYGNRAANGVILVTTKRGAFNQDLLFRFNSSIGFTNPINTVDVLDAPTLAELKRERYTNDGIPINPIWEDPQYQTQRTNWQDELLGTGTIQDYNLSIQGGSERSSFFISGNFADEKGMMKSSYFDRYGLKINSNHNVGERLSISQNLTIARTTSNTLNTQSAQLGVLWSAIRFHPGLPVQFEDGSYSSNQISGEFGDINNPIFTVEEDSDSNNERRRVLGNVQADLDLVHGFSLRGNVGIDYQLNDFYAFNVIVDDQIRARSRNSLSREFSETTTILSELILNFNQSIGQNHDIDGLTGIILETSKGDLFSASRQDFANESTLQRVLDAGDTVYLANGSKWEDSLLSYLGRMNYAYADKYLLTGSLRYDGSSRFSPDTQWGVFPAFSVGWRLSEESFFNELSPHINNLRLTAGWGRSGNQSIDRHQFLGLYSQNAQYSFEGAQVRGISQTRIPNPDISWEVVEMLNIGLHTGLLNDKVTGSIEYFIRNSKDVLLAPPTLGTLGTATVPDTNVGEIQNKGVEFQIGYNSTIGDLDFNISGNASFIRNKVVNINNNFLSSRTYGRPNQELARTFQGHPIATFYGWKTDGLYQNQEEIDSDPNLTNDSNRSNIQPGDVRFLDLNGDGEIDGDDRTILGSPHPDVTYGLNMSSGYKNFNLNLHFVGTAGVEIFNADRMQGLDPTYPFNMYSEVENRWNGEGTSNSIPRMTTLRDNLNHRSSDLFIENGSYFRLKTVTLGYDLPLNITGLLGMSRARLYVTGVNVFTITPYSGMDPELGYTDGNLQRNVDFAQYPQPRSLTFGVSIDF